MIRWKWSENCKLLLWSGGPCLFKGSVAGEGAEENHEYCTPDKYLVFGTRFDGSQG
jgi:hypothetical protein